MMVQRLATLIVVIGMGSAATAALPQGNRSWVTREVIRSEDIVPLFSDVSGYNASSQIDLDQDGHGDWHLDYVEVDAAGQHTQHFRLFSGFKGRQHWSTQETIRSDVFQKVVLRSGPFPRLALSGWDRTPSLDFPSIWDLHRRYWIGDVHLGLNPPQPPLNSMSRIFRGGDVNGDGTDDFFFKTYPPGTSTVASLGLVDGWTGEIKWEFRSYQDFWITYTYWTRPGPTPDLDGDGASDFVFTEIMWPIQGQFDYRILALSGADGHLIWSFQDSNGPFWSKTSAILRDVDGDGLEDVFTYGGGEFTMLSGRTGARIWWGSSQILDPVLPPTVSSYWYPLGASSTGVQGQPGNWEIVMPVDLIQPGDDLPALAHFDSSNGQLVDLAFLPDTLAPWAPNPISFYGLQGIGDIDGDGHEEFVQSVPSPLTTIHSQGVDHHLAIFGQQTLYAPDTVRIGQTLTIPVSIPTGAHCPFRVLLSDGFDRTGGFRVDGWRTHLVPTPLFHRSAGWPALGGTLDAKGEGSVSLDIPYEIPLIGTVLYSKALIEDPARPGKVRTMSSLGITEIVP